MVAWLSLARRPRPTALIAGAVLILATLLVARDHPAVRPSILKYFNIKNNINYSRIILI
jgi:hypothetical protein